MEIKPVFVTYEDEKVYDNIIMENRKNKKKYRCCIKAIRESWCIQKHLSKNEKCQQTKTNKF